jgi:hypothetical protein
MEWDEFISHMRSSLASPTTPLAVGSRPWACSVRGCDGVCAAGRPTTLPAPPAPSVAPAPAPSVAPVAPAAPVAAATPVKTPEQTMFEFIAGNYYGLNERLISITYRAYTLWLNTQTVEFKTSKTPYDLMTYYLADTRTTDLEYYADSKMRYDRILLLQRFFPRRSVMEMKEIIYPLYMKWCETAVLPPKVNRWQKMKAFATEYGTLA